MSLDVVGKLARVTAEITPGHLGEVMIEVRQGTERFLARGADKDATIPRYTQVLVVGSLGGRTVEVFPDRCYEAPKMTLDAGVAIIIVLVVIVVVLVALALLFRASWRVAEPDEALIISGLRASGRPVGTGESMGFNIVTGRGALILPGLTKVRRLSLEAHESEITVPCVSQQKIQVDLRGIVVYKVGDDYQSIANAARGASWIGRRPSSRRRSRTCSWATSGPSRDR